MRRPISVTDAETDPFKRRRVPKPFIWGWFDGETYKTFDTTDELVGWLEDWDGICYAHNGGRFDWHFLLPYVKAYDEIMIIAGRIAKMKIGKCELRDSMNILPVPLKGMEKEEFDYSLMEEGVRDLPANRRKIHKYLRSDCENLLKFVLRFIDDYGLHLTQAGAAMAQWKKLSVKPIPKTDKEFYDEISPYYVGGRVECFRAGVIEGRYRVYDIKSAYPEAMCFAHPYSSNFVRQSGYVDGADFYRLRCRSLGAFPYRVSSADTEFKRGSLVFPSDGKVREFFVTKWEVEAARETGTLLEVDFIESTEFYDSQDFKPYIDFFFALKEECEKAGDKEGRFFAKIFLNALYGKWAANPQEYKNYMVVPMHVIGGLESVGWEYAGEFGPWGLAQTDLQEERQRFYNVATGASITGFVRAKLWKAICSSKGVVYCDTDSITCEEPGDSVEIGGELGQWTLEGEFDRLGIGGKKMYIMRGAPGWWVTADGKTVFSESKPKGAERLYKTAAKGARLTNNQLWAVARGERVHYESEVPTFSPRKEPTFIKRDVRRTA